MYGIEPIATCPDRPARPGCYKDASAPLEPFPSFPGEPQSILVPGLKYRSDKGFSEITDQICKPILKSEWCASKRPATLDFAAQFPMSVPADAIWQMPLS